MWNLYYYLNLCISEVQWWFNAFLLVIGDIIGLIHNFFIFLLVIIELFSGTKLFKGFKFLLIFAASFIVFTSIAIFLGKSPAEKLDIGLNMHEFCKKYGYKIQDEIVTTEDGYFLTLHRIKNVLNNTLDPRKNPVLLLHGLLGSSADFVAARNESLAFQLVNQGYDVWMGNNRGNTYSRKHIMLEADEDRYFWDFSYHEMGNFDIPAMIDHIIKKTRNSKVNFIGMSQGCAAFMAMLSLKPEYNNKINLASLIAPVTTFYPTQSIVFKFLSFFNFFLEIVLSFKGFFEVFGDTTMETTLLRYFCLGPHKIANYICIDIALKYGVGYSDQKNYDIFPFHISVTPAGASIKQFHHMTQNRKSGKFAQYDYYNKNLEVYNQTEAPIYDISKITVPVAVYFGRGDIFVSVQGLYEQLKSISNVVLRYKVPCKDFNHLDFIYAKDLNFLVNNKILSMLNSYNNRIKI